MKNKISYGRIIQINKNYAIQFVAMNNKEDEEFINVTGRGVDINIPLDAISEALEDSWERDSALRSERYKEVS